MCGIAGIFQFDQAQPVAESLLAEMTDLLAHRGPDDRGLLQLPGVGLGHRRLAILDLSPAGHQPMANEDGQVWVCYNGECYNYQPLVQELVARGHQFRSRSDTEVLLHLYEEAGPAMLDRLSGMFAFAIYDRRDHRLLLARDRLGIKPLFYYTDGKRLLFASEMKALLADPSVPRHLRPEVVADWLYHLHPTGNECIFADIHQLPAGHYLEVVRGHVQVRQYWDVPAVALPGTADVTRAAAEFVHRFDQVVGEHLIADVPVGIFLSGGIDSSSVARAVAQRSTGAVRSFNIGFAGHAAHDETDAAVAVARQFGFVHQAIELPTRWADALPVMVWHADEPFAVASAFATFFLAQIVSREVKVVLTGDGADEVFGGYPWRHGPLRLTGRWWREIQAVSRIGGGGPGRLARLTQGLASDLWHWRREVYWQSQRQCETSDLLNLLSPAHWPAILRARQEAAIRHVYDQWPGTHELDRRLYTDVKTTLVSQMLTKVDRMTMAWGLEARVPFLDHRLVEWAFSLPPPVKIRGRTGKLLLRSALEQALPPAITARRKQGFGLPVGELMRGPLRPLLHDTMASAAFRRRGYFVPATVERLQREHDAKLHDHGEKLLQLLVFELWCRSYLDQPVAVATRPRFAA